MNPLCFFVGPLIFSIAKLASGEQAKQSEKEPTTAEVVASIGDIAGDRTLELQLEAIAEGMPVGFCRTSLSSTGSSGSGTFKYEAELVISLGQGARIEGWIKALLGPTLEPIEIELRRELVAPNGKRKTTVHRIKIRDTDVLHTLEVDGNPATQQHLPRPESPFVFALEFVVQRTDIERFPAFALREFDVEDRTVKTQHFSVETGSGGIRRLASREDSGEVGYVFEVDGKGELLSWIEPPLSVVFKRCSRERFGELRKSMR